MAHTTTIQVDGQPVQAYDLIMRRGHALEIIAGTKPLELRVFSDHYHKMFTDTAVVAENERLIAAGHEDECVEPVRTDI